VDGEEAMEAAEDSQTQAEVGLTGEVGVVDVEAEVVDVAAEAEDDHLHPRLKSQPNMYIFFFYPKNLIKP
jgi:hypothetical protein